ncbi:response regulator transcription factor [Azospirillum halopraeferens]|uniref:response regulator transcription factor n=1 Tax=Azospirillum halopraeferens TaxID=34010 RepID=UPI0003FF0705|nr:response regulator [Azospirillum halopraeferens]
MARILVVDDMPAVTALLRVALEDSGHSVAEARDGAACLDLVRREPFDLVVVDMMMPGVDGIETVKRLRAGGYGSPIIAMSGGTEDFPAAASLKMSEMHGANRLLFKPFDNEELIAAIDELLAARGA